MNNASIADNVTIKRQRSSLNEPSIEVFQTDLRKSDAIVQGMGMYHDRSARHVSGSTNFEETMDKMFSQCCVV